jgi:hypothetical protein
MVGVGADTEMETFLSGNLDQVSITTISLYITFVFHLGDCQKPRPLISNNPLC